MSTPASRTGLLAAGNFIVDYVKLIDYYPGEEMLASILSEQSANGGGPFNVLCDLSRMGAAYPLEAAGLIGRDATGAWIREQCAARGVNTDRLLPAAEGVSTSYTDAFTVASTGRRTFFHQSGANAKLSPEDFDFTGVTARVFYLGYLMLLDTLDAIDAAGRSGASRVLERASAAGLITAADMVSIENADFARSALSSLPYVDHFILNEIEAGKLTGTPLRDAATGALHAQATADAARRLIALGVRKTVTIHFVEGAITADSDGGLFHQASLQVPPETIRGATGAGDAFAAGLLHGIHEGHDIQTRLLTAVCAAAACLADPTPSGGLLPLADCLALADKFGVREPVL